MKKSLIIIGSRPTDLYGYDTNKDGSPNQAVANEYAALRNSITQYIKDNGITDVYTTLDLGAEQYGAEAAINARVNLHALVPYPNQEAKWPKGKQDNYNKILQYATDTTQISDVYDKDSNKKRINFLKGIVSDTAAGVLMVYDGHEGENAMYTLNALKKECKDNGVQPPDFLNPKTRQISDAQPFPERPRIVSQERIDEIIAHNESKRMNGRYTRAERKDMSDIWNAYLDKLELRPEHERDLLNRGFTKEQITEFKYKSLPQTKEEADSLVKSLMDDGWDLSKAPGFAIAEDGGAFSTRIMNDGYFCPAHDTETNTLYGMQIRNCNKEEAKKYGKYTWFSAGGDAIGLSSSQPAAYYEGNMTMDVGGKERPVILITEGVLKCNLAYLGMGRQIGIVGMAGVYGQKGLYVYDEKGEAETLAPEDARHLFKDAIVVECFDADFVKNKNVRGASYRIRNELVDKYGAYATCRMTWDDEGKGIDDFVVDCNRQGKDIRYNLSNVIVAGSPTEVIKNEWGKDETRHIEIKDINQSPLAGLAIDIKMEDVYAAGYKIQPKIEEPVSETQPEETPKEPEKPVINEKDTKEYKDRKRIEHMNEWTGRRDPIFKQALPAKIDLTTEIVDNAGKFIVNMPSYSTLDVDLKRCKDELTGIVEDIIGMEETKNKTQKIYISDAIPGKDKKSVVMLYNGFDEQGKRVSMMLKGAIDDTFHREEFDIGRTFTVSDTELESAISQYGDKDRQHKPYTRTLQAPNVPESGNAQENECKLNESLVVENLGAEGGYKASFEF